MKKWSLNAKIVFVVGVFAFSMTAVISLGLWQLYELNQSITNVGDKVVTRVKVLKTMDAWTNELRNQENVFILEESAEGMKRAIDALEDIEGKILSGMDEYEKIATEVGVQKAKDMRTHLSAWSQVNKELRSLALAGHDKEAFAMSQNKSMETLGKFDEILNHLVFLNEKVLDEEINKTDQIVVQARNEMIAVGVGSLIIGSLLALFILRTLNRRIDDIVTRLHNNSDQVTSASQQIASSSEELSHAANEQAASLQETAASIEEMNSMVQRTSENSDRAAQLSSSSRESAVRGQKVVSDMIRAIDEINDANRSIMTQIDESNSQISTIVQVINEIATKTKVINDIVFQTKLLSFNASVEAARAGEHGKGFAVVAEEIGNLARMSGNAAQDIAKMLDESSHKVESIVNETKTSVEALISTGKEKVEVGTHIAHQCGEVLIEIVQSVSTVTEMAGQISSASREQAQGVQEITKAMNQLDQVTQTNASGSEQTANAAEELSAQAEALRCVVASLLETVKGHSAQSAPSTPKTHPKKQSRTQPAKVVTLHQPRLLKNAAGFDGDLEAPGESDPRFQDL